MPRLSKWSLSFSFPTKTLYAILFSPIHAIYPFSLSPWSPEYLVMIKKNHEAPQCAVFSSILSLPPSYTQISPSATVDQRSKNSSQKHNYICMYNSVPTTCFGCFLTGHHQVGYNVGGTIYLLKYSHWWQCEYRGRGGWGGRDLVYKK